MKKHNKVAQITILFWILKILATTLGETFGDLLSLTWQLGYAIALAATGLLFVVVLLLQLKQVKYKAWCYWLVIIATTTLGTEISDFVDRSLHVGYVGGSLILVFLLIATLGIWYRNFGNLNVYPISNSKKEIFYWVAILFSNSLGTAFGDYLTDVVGLGYIYGASITGSIILLVVALHYVSKINTVLLFWIAFVFTRPFGATFGDLLTKPLDTGGLALGTLPASLIALALMAGILFISERKKCQHKI